jgi:hypothetical protein
MRNVNLQKNIEGVPGWHPSVAKISEAIHQNGYVKKKRWPIKT